MIRLQLNKGGVIKVSKDQATPFQCVVSGHGTYHYWCEIVAIDPILDERGFLADHAEISEVIEKVFENKPFPSCELAIIEIAKAVSSHLTSKRMLHSSVYIRLTNIPEGS